MGAADLAVLVAAAVATAALTAAVGLGGGVILLSVMLLYWDPLVAIPIHGVVQLASNASRTAVQRRHVDWGRLGLYALPLLPAGVAGLWVAQEVPPAAARAVIGVFVLLAVWAPRALLLGLHPERTHPRRRFLWLGLAVGFLNPTVGAVGPVLGPFFRGLGLSRHAVVGTFAAAQTLGHAVKIALFAAAGFAFLEHAGATVLLVAGVVVGTGLGSLLLDRLDERTFAWLYKGALTAVALRLAVWEPLLG